MISPVNSSPDVQSVAPPTESRRPAQAKKNPPVQDTVQISQAAVQALKAKPAESAETPDQTMQEANSGDPIAIAKLARKV
jgi:hypothetical protein